ncbi:MAG TPA: zf-HC2 domain-containing protein [Terriglobales bacterium]|nr:zf-HC2 domain-containing protein [Terriglobales bacterium]
MKCAEAKSMFSPYLDGAVPGTQMHALGLHLDKCSDCNREYALLRQTQELLASVGRRKPSADLALKLRVAISREVAEAKRPRFQGLLVRLENALHPFMVPATAGIVVAVVIFGFVIGLTMPELQARNTNDVPLMLYTGPELQESSFAATLSSVNEDSLVIEAYVDANGRVQDYRIISDPDNSQKLLPEVKRMLIFTTFRPAMSMGRPTSGHAVLSFSKISVRG